jgi:hypothetical protein
LRNSCCSKRATGRSCKDPDAEARFPFVEAITASRSLWSLGPSYPACKRIHQNPAQSSHRCRKPREQQAAEKGGLNVLNIFWRRTLNTSRGLSTLRTPLLADVVLRAARNALVSTDVHVLSQE